MNRLEELIKTYIDEKGKEKNIKGAVSGIKQEIADIMSKEKITEYSCDCGTVIVSDSVQDRIDKEKVESEVTKLNNKEISNIEMKDLYKQVDIHKVSIKANKKSKEDK